MTAAADIANALGAKGRGPRWVARCPAHDDAAPSLSIGTGDDGRVLLHCFAGCTFADIASTPIIRGLLDDDREHDRRHDRPAPRPRAAQPADTATIADILRPAVSLPGTLGERYFSMRGCARPTGDSVRYLAPSAKYPWPTIVSIVTDFVTAEPISLHFTALNKDGTDKAPIEKPRRLLYGHRKSGGVIRLTDDCDVERHLGIAEGIESALAVTAAMGTMAYWIPVWSAIDAGNLADLPVLGGIQRLSIFADTDRSGTGQKAAQALAARWHAAGREVFIIQPPAPEGEKRDWNNP